MSPLLVAACAVAVNCMYCVAALGASARYRLRMSLSHGCPLGILFAGTIVQCACVLTQDRWPAQCAAIAGIGGVVVASACDAASGYVFDAVTFPCLALLGLFAAATHTLSAVAIGAAATGGALAVPYALTRGRGLGLGDVKLACCIGGVAGAVRGLEALGIAFVAGGAYAAYLLIAKRAERSAELRFAPYLGAGMAAILLYGANA